MNSASLSTMAAGQVFPLRERACTELLPTAPCWMLGKERAGSTKGIAPWLWHRGCSRLLPAPSVPLYLWSQAHLGKKAAPPSTVAALPGHRALSRLYYIIPLLLLFLAAMRIAGSEVWGEAEKVGAEASLAVS